MAKRTEVICDLCKVTIPPGQRDYGVFLGDKSTQWHFDVCHKCHEDWPKLFKRLWAKLFGKVIRKGDGK